MASQAVLYTHDLDRMAAFYADGIGLTPGEASHDHRELRTSDLVLWLVRGQAPAPKLDRDGVVMRRSDVPLKLGFAVASIELVASSVERLGGRIAGKNWKFAGYRRCDVTDPEGNVIQLLEPITPDR